MDDSIDLFCRRSTLYLEDAVSGSGGDSFANETAEKSKVQKEFDGKGKTGTGTTGLLIMPGSWWSSQRSWLKRIWKSR
jgi:hypothetical protein